MVKEAKMKNRAFVYTIGILLLFSCFSHAIGDISHYNIPINITTIIKNGKNKNALNLINKRVKTQKRHLLTVKKSNTSEQYLRQKIKHYPDES